MHERINSRHSSPPGQRRNTQWNSRQRSRSRSRRRNPSPIYHRRKRFRSRSRSRDRYQRRNNRRRASRSRSRSRSRERRAMDDCAEAYNDRERTQERLKPYRDQHGEEHMAAPVIATINTEVTAREKAVTVETTLAVESHAPVAGPGYRDGRLRSRGGGRRGRGQRGKKVSVPDNWADVPKMGERIGSSRFIPMRVPLDAKYSHLLTSEEQWNPYVFHEEQKRLGHDIRMVIDLTNTFKYYDGAAEFEGTGIEYVKLKIEGFRGPPRDYDVAKFIEIVDAFVAKESTGNIAVHCTHGLNRTGYLIVNYLVQRLGSTVKDALAAFTASRPPGLIKHMYVEELYRRLGKEEELELPVLPDWAVVKYGKAKR